MNRFSGGIGVVRRGNRRWVVHYRGWDEINGTDIGPTYRTMREAVEKAVAHVRKQLGKRP